MIANLTFCGIDLQCAVNPPPNFLPFLLLFPPSLPLSFSSPSLSPLFPLPPSLLPFLPLFFLPQHKLKQSQRSKVRQFMTITGTDEHTAINCLTQNEWRLDMATDNFYQDPIRYFVEPPRAAVDRKKLDSLFNKYRSTFRLSNDSVCNGLSSQLVLIYFAYISVRLLSFCLLRCISLTLPISHSLTFTGG